MSRIGTHKIINFFIAAVWAINGLICKVLNFVPRHEAIVASILGSSHSRLFTILIGIAEVLMALWVASGVSPRLNAISQLIVIVIMNYLEYFMVPDLLFWGRLNALFAFAFMLMIYINTFYFSRKAPSAL
jgi:hypothetical protein